MNKPRAPSEQKPICIKFDIFSIEKCIETNIVEIYNWKRFVHIPYARKIIRND